MPKNALCRPVAKLALIAWASVGSSIGVARPLEDIEYKRAVERAQDLRPRELSSTARIAPEGEPGTPLVIHGRVFAADGKTPSRGTVVFAYHTDRNGIYDRREAGPHSWRLKGWVATDDDGRFEFRTIRPAAYPTGKTAAHVHFALFTSKTGLFQSAGLLFDGDPLLSAAERAESARAGRFGAVRPIRREHGTEHVDLEIRLDSP